MARDNWTRDQLIIAFNLYCKTPFTKINSSNKDIIRIAPLIGRTPGALAMKLANFARLDPDLQSRGISGLKRGAQGEVDIWREFHENWEGLAFESEKISTAIIDQGNQDEPSTSKFDESELDYEGKDRLIWTKQRINQNFFRASVLASYNYRCCITGIQIPELLVAGHIIPWSVDINNRVNPSNGICLNSLHDKAFDKGLITISTDLKVQVSSKLLQHRNNTEVTDFFLPYHGRTIISPQRFFPKKVFLEYHNSFVFKG